LKAHDRLLAFGRAVGLFNGPGYAQAIDAWTGTAVARLEDWCAACLLVI
jgi:hypothetical protein